MACDGICVDFGEIPAFSVPPHGEAVIKLNVKVPEKGRVYLKILYRFLNESPLVPKGHMLGFDEILLENEDGRNQAAVKWLNRKTEADAAVDVEETDSQVIINGNGFLYGYSKKTGLFERINYGGREYLDRPMEINIWRAPTDNDMYAKLEWKKAHFHEAYARAYDTFVRQSKDKVVISSTMSVSAASIQRILDVKVVWTIDGRGSIGFKLNVVKNKEFPELPRFGVRLFLSKQLEHVSYYGYGPVESYCDKHRAASHGLYHAHVRELHEDYLRPQENGSHFDCDYVEISGSQFGLTAVSEQRFSFNASVYTQEELEEKAHNFELQESGSTVLCLDYGLNGIGSNSCGPEVMNPYRFDEKQFCFRCNLVPFVKV